MLLSEKILAMPVVQDKWKLARSLLSLAFIPDRAITPSYKISVSRVVRIHFGSDKIRWNLGAPILHDSSNNAANRSCMSREVAEAIARRGNHCDRRHV